MEQVLEYIKRAHQGDKAARDLLVQNNLGLVWSIGPAIFQPRIRSGGSVSGGEHRSVKSNRPF